MAANLNPRGMVGRIDVVNHYALQHTKHRSCRLHGFREDFLSYSPLYGKLNVWKLDLQGVANLDPRGTIFVGDHPTLLYTKYTSCGRQGYRKEDLKKKIPL